MTADVRAELADWLERSMGDEVWSKLDAEELADALLPVVRRLCDQRAAEALEEAATDVSLPGIFPSTQRWLLDRAAALAAGTEAAK